MGFTYSNRLLLSIGLLSMSMIAYQLSLIQYLSIIQWYHFAYMVITIALLGFGGAGTILSIYRKRLISRIEVRLPLFIMLSGVFMPLSLWLSVQGFAKFDTYLLFVEQKEVWKLFIFELLFFIPFFFCALAIGMVFIGYTRNIGKFYFSNLVGSGLGGLLAIILFWITSPTQIPFITGLLTVLASLFIIPEKNINVWRGVIISLSIILLYFSVTSPLKLQLSQYKSLSRTLDLPETKIESSANSPFGYVQYISSSVLRYAPGLSLSYSGEIPTNNAVFNNGEWAGIILKSGDDSKILDYTTSSIGLELIRPEKVLILNAGSGIKSLYYDLHSSIEIDHVEVNPLINKLSKVTLPERINIHQEDARSFLSRSNGKYNLISLPDIGNFGGNAGLKAISEDYLFTIQGFFQMLDHLESDGLLSITVWIDYPYRNPLKITSSLVEVLLEKGIDDPGSHLIAVRSWNNITYLLRKEAFTKDEVNKVREFCERLSFDPLILTGVEKNERNFHNILEDESLFRLTDSLLSNDREKLYDSYDFNIRPTTDDRPYFSQFLKWKSLSKLKALFGHQTALFFELGYLILAVTFLQSLLLAIFLIILPLLILRGKIKSPSWSLAYFSGIGIGFMFVEIVFIQRFILFLGQTAYSVAAVIGLMLFCSGLGSWFSSRYPSSLKILKKITLIITGILAMYALTLPTLLYSVMGFPMAIKLILSLVIIGVPSFFMGFPFPIALRYISQNNKNGVPWAWAINGCISVISASLATILAVLIGFKMLTLLATLAYLVTFGSCYLNRRGV